MKRRTFLLNTAVLTAGSLLYRQHALAAIFKVKPGNIRMLRENIGIFTERGGTIGFLLSKKSTIVIDAQFADTSQHFIADMKERAAAPFTYLFNTHHHRDHTEGNLSFKGIVEHVVAHENAVANQRTAAEKNNTIDKQLFADLTFKEEWKLKGDDVKLRGHYFGPAHTNGDAVYHFENENVIHTGDLMFNKRHPVIDRNAGASISNWVRVLDKVIKKGDRETIYIFGHALNSGEETGSATDLAKFQDYLQKLLQFAQAEHHRGVTKEEFIKSTAIPGVTEWSGQGLERTLTAAYDEVAAVKQG
ncbi:MAG TPA: MBL fold metallo-hydrolase [Flavisolibacter sp.]